MSKPAIKIRPWSMDDLPDLLRYANHWDIAKYLTDQFSHPYTEYDGISFLELVTTAKPITVFAIDIGGVACGGIGIEQQEDIFRKNAELGYWLGKPFWGKGYMTEAVKIMIEFAFMSFDIDRLFARPFGSNLASQRVLERCGFKLEARFKNTLFKNGEYFDELVYGIRRAEVSNK